VVVNQSPRSSALFRALHPEEAEWGLAEHLAAAIFDVLQSANWQRQGDNRAPRPKPLERPGVKPQSKRYGTTAVPMNEMARRLGWEVSDG